MKVICAVKKESMSFFLHFNPYFAESAGEIGELLSGSEPCLLFIDALHITPGILKAVREKRDICLASLIAESPEQIGMMKTLYPEFRLISLANVADGREVFSAEMFKDILASEYVNDMIYGHPERILELDFLFRTMHIKITPQIVFTIVFDDFWTICEKKDNVYRYRLKRTLLNSTRKVLERGYSAVSATLMGTDKVVVLLNCRDLTGEDAEDYAARCAELLLSEIKKMTGYSVSIGMSCFCAAPALLCRAYEQSFRALEQSFMAGPGQLLRYQSPSFERGKTSKAGGSPALREQGKKDLIVAVTTQDDALCAETLNHIFAGLAMQNADSSYIKSLSVSILSELAGYGVGMGLDAVDISSKVLSVTGAIFKANTMNDVKAETYQFLQGLSRSLKSGVPKSTPLDMAAAYLEQYYMNNPGLNEVADLCGYSPAYFSRAFKARFGVNFVRYSREVQLKNAKKLLRGSDLSLAQIAEKTGFQTTSYLGAVFKKEVGLSPGNYRILSESGLHSD